MDIIKKCRNFINSGSERTKTVKKNAINALLIKCLSMFIDFAKVPILLSYLDSERYGLYVTITSIVYWSQNFDFGLGAGLRYKLTVAISENDTIYGKQLVSTAYFTMSVIMSLVLIVLLPIINFLNWDSLLNTSLVDSRELAFCVSVVLVVFVVQFVLELITYVLQAYQRTAISTIFKPIANLTTLIVILVLRLVSENSLLYACLVMTVPILIVLFVCNVIYYSKSCKEVSPSKGNIRMRCLKDIYSLGLKNFVSQLAVLIVFQTSAFLISHYVNPTEAASYNTAFTYFGVIVIFNNMMLIPLTVAITDAYIKNDYTWLKSIMSKINKISLLLSFISFIMLCISPIVFQLWVGDKLIISWSLCICMTIYFVLNIWTTPYSNFIGGVGKLNVAMILSILKIILYLPIAIVLVKMIGTTGVILSIIVVNTLPNNILFYIQYRKIVNKTAEGIWNK